MNYQQVKQALQEFIFNCAIPTRVGFQNPFTNITLDIKPSPSLADQPVIIGGQPQKETYAEFQEEMNIFNRAFYEVMMEGDAKQRVFTFPIPTINITKDFPWDSPALEPLWEATAKYGLPAGELGPIYGGKWRHWKKREGGEIDQIAQVVEDLKRNPDSRRLVVTSWDPEDVDKVFVAPCHCFFKFFHAQGKLSLHLFQRSCDVFLGVPFNIASYSLLLMMMAQATGLKAHEFVHTLSDAHIYLNHLEQVKLQLSREPKLLPKMTLNPEIKNIFDFKYEDFKLEGYDPHPSIKADIGI